jgi:hypothetical protein
VTLDLLLAAKRKHEQAKTSLRAQVELLETDWRTGAVHAELFSVLEVFIKACEQGKAPRLLIELPPGFGKTLMVSRHLPAFIWSKHPKWFQIVGTYNQDRANEVGRDFRRVMQNETFQQLHPNLELDSRTTSMDYLETTKGGKLSFVGVGAGATGKRAHAFIVDDPFKDMEEADSELMRKKVDDWFMSVAYTRMLPGCGIIILHTRWHEDDLIGRRLAAAKIGGDQWMSYKFPLVATVDEFKADGTLRRRKGQSLHPERFPEEMCQKMKDTYYASKQGRIWSALYQQNPVPDDGNFFKAEWFKRTWYDPRTIQFPTARTYGITTDFATSEGSGDWSITWPFFLDDKDDIWFLDDIFLEQCDTQRHAEDIWSKIAKYDARYLFVEKGVILNGHRPEFRTQQTRRKLYNVKMVEFARTKKKKEHSVALANHMQQNKVHFPDTPFFRERIYPLFLGFDNLKQDDPIDAAALPFLSFHEMMKPEAEVELPDALPSDYVHDYIKAQLDADEKPAPNRRAFYAEDD